MEYQLESAPFPIKILKVMVRWKNLAKLATFSHRNLIVTGGAIPETLNCVRVQNGEQ